jgi:hypothetical protein
VKGRRLYLAGAVALATLLVYLKSLQNDFVGWDDNFYVTANPYIRSFNFDFFRWAFFDFHSYNWHPLTWISHAVDYAVWGLDPAGHHLTGVLLHATNAFVVTLLATRLMEEAKKTAPEKETSPFLEERAILIAAGATGLLFGLHPLHVESVAWIAERKDLLSALFFLLSVLAYTRCSRIFDKHYFLALGFFLLALLSKPMAVTLPFVLLILDWYPFRKIQSLKTFRKALVEKVPFLLLSLFSSIVTVLAQRSGSAIWEEIPLGTRLLVAAKSLVAYLWKMPAPVNLLPFYPHPRNVSFFSFEYFSAAALVIGITAACLVVSGRRKIWLSAWCYYAGTLVPVLGIVQVGGQSMADRYTYLPSIGPFLIVGLFAAWCFHKVDAIAGRGPIVIVSAAAAILLLGSMSYLTYRQIGIWKNGIGLWTYVIEKEPERVLFAYYSRGHALSRTGRYHEAIGDYSKVIALNYKEYSQVFVDRGLTYMKIGQVGLALADFRKACALGDDFGCKAAQGVEKMLSR